VVFDRDYRSDAEVAEAVEGLSEFCSYVHIHKKKEIENFLLVPSALERAIDKRVSEQNKRTGGMASYDSSVTDQLRAITDEMKYEVQAQFHERRRPYAKTAAPSLDDTTIAAALLEEFDTAWADLDQRLDMVPGKDVLARFRAQVHKECGVNVSTNVIIDAMTDAEVPTEMREIVAALDVFAKASPASRV